MSTGVRAVTHTPVWQKARKKRANVYSMSRWTKWSRM